MHWISQAFLSSLFCDYCSGLMFGFMEKKRIQSFFTKTSPFYQVALYQWLYQNLEAVASMYEDRFDLWTFESQLIDKVDNSWNENYSWWKRLIPRKSDTVSSTLDHVLINNFCMPVKRTKELRALTGWYDLLPIVSKFSHLFIHSK